MSFKNLSTLDKQIVHCRYLAGLTNRETADQLNVGFWQVKYRIRKPQVRAYIRKRIIPKLVKVTLLDIDKKLSDPMRAFGAYIRQQTDAKTYVWCNKRRNWYNDNGRQIKALRRISSIYGLLSGRQNHNRDIERWMRRMVSELKQKRSRILAAYNAGVFDARVYH